MTLILLLGFDNTVSIGFYDQSPSEGLRSLNTEWSLKQESGYSDQVVTIARTLCFANIIDDYLFNE